MKIRTEKNLSGTEFGYPLFIYFFVRLQNEYPLFGRLLDWMENGIIAEDIRETTIESPAYVTGFARAGSTIVLEMLDSHKEFASHRYFQIASTRTPYLMTKFIERVPLMTEFSERVHNDRILVNRDSPEGLEEIYWQSCFRNVFDENRIDILDESVENEKFERFYSNQMKKLIISQNRNRYVAKNNYVVTRIDFVRKMFPRSKFIILVRNPVNHISSLIKQDILIRRLELQDPRLVDWERMVGHREFGIDKKCINLGNDVKEIRSLWKRKKSYVRGWARYWADVYSYIHDKLQKTSDLLLVRYEDLCEKSNVTIDRIFSYLSVGDYDDIRRMYANILKKPRYYDVSFSKDEKQAIIDETSSVAKKYGYDIDESN